MKEWRFPPNLYYFVIYNQNNNRKGQVQISRNLLMKFTLSQNVISMYTQMYVQPSLVQSKNQELLAEIQIITDFYALT